MKLTVFKTVLLSVLFLTLSFTGFASNEEKKKEQDTRYDPKEMIMHHIKDAHAFHLWDWKGHAVAIPLPIILWTDNGFTTFMSSRFQHDDSGKVVVEENGGRFVKFHEKIYQLNNNATGLTFDAEHHPTNAIKPLDISITKNVFMMWVSIIVLLLVFLTAARSYKKSKDNVPTGIASFVEPLIIFVRDDIAKPMIGEKKYKKYMPYLLTVFFFIWINNIWIHPNL